MTDLSALSGAERRQAVQRLNDAFRRTFLGGKVLFTCGFLKLPPATQRAFLKAIVDFNDFRENDDPWGEHDFVAVSVGGINVFAKIDYYDKAFKRHSPDPANAAVTNRVMTVMLAEEY